MAPLTEQSSAAEKDAHYAELAKAVAADASVPAALRKLAADPRVTVRVALPFAKEGKCVVYWMQRSQRGQDNHALNLAIAVGNALGLPVVAYFAGISNFPHANLRHYAFLNQGLPDVAEACAVRHVGFVLRNAPHEDHERFFADVHAAFVIGDENPMREPERWRIKIAHACEHTLRIPYWTVDSDVIVPSRLLQKSQFSAAVARPRLFGALAEFLVPYENPNAEHPWTMPRNLQHDVPAADMTQHWKDFDRSVLPVDAWHGGHKAAVKRLQHFCTNLLPGYSKERSHPEVDGSSKLSPYLHYGHIGPQTIALAVNEAAKNHKETPKAGEKSARDGFLDELITWRELSVNFVRYQPEYDNPGCADNWAKQTIAEHDNDPRETLYKLPVLERGETADELWNAAQLQMVKGGWMHNYLRMYWAKKLLEWTPNVTIAMKVAVYLNDKYEIDGRDPGGYAGIAWSMLGKFDRVWFDRPIFGKRRYMSGASTGKKFDSRTYIKQIKLL